MSRVLVVCGPTASGKSDVSDGVSGELSVALSRWVETILIDSMQVYREIPVVSNQARRRPAQLRAVASVGEDWTVARHRERARDIVEADGGPCVMEAGTGMYLNATLLDIPLAPGVSGEVRERARERVGTGGNVRRRVREEEIQLGGFEGRGSIWEGRPVFETGIIYLRPPRGVLDKAIAKRSSAIVEEAVEEVRSLMSLTRVNASVRDSIGVRELVSYIRGEMTLREAEDSISARTRRLARRQVRWFDKLARSLPSDIPLHVIEEPSRDEQYLQARTRADDIIGAW